MLTLNQTSTVYRLLNALVRGFLLPPRPSRSHCRTFLSLIAPVTFHFKNSSYPKAELPPSKFHFCCCNTSTPLSTSHPFLKVCLLHGTPEVRRTTVLLRILLLLGEGVKLHGATQVPRKTVLPMILSGAGGKCSTVMTRPAAHHLPYDAPMTQSTLGMELCQHIDVTCVLPPQLDPLVVLTATQYDNLGSMSFATQ